MNRRTSSPGAIGASMSRPLWWAAILFLFVIPLRAGGPKYVAGTSYFQSTATGQPLTWAQGQLLYFTDQGDLSPVLPNSDANTFVTNAFNQWTSVPTAALTATSGGQLAEDVSGANVIRNPDGTITMPADIQPTATATPIGVVYDEDGSVTNALIGAGAGDASQCFYNAVYGGDDNESTSGFYQHALIVINGQCVQAQSQEVDVEYRLIRVIGSVLGLGWSQLNLNVNTGNPTPTSDDFAGFPVMHQTDATSCAPITTCYPNPLQLAVDDVAAVSRLYPVTAANQANFPGKQVFASSTARIHGSVWFTDRFGNRTQPMQGVNVVARWIDSSNQPSGQYAASSVSGFLYAGNQGNPITGFVDGLGQPFTKWGSNDSTLEGLYDLGGLQIPSGTTAQYQLTVEPVDATWSFSVGPYAPYLVTPSGAPVTPPITVTLSAGQDAVVDILMNASAQPVPLWTTPASWTGPARVPTSGAWQSSLNAYGESSYFLLPIQANRTLSVAAVALNEAGSATESKVQPVIGMWAATDPEGTMPGARTTSPFNTVFSGLTRLDAQVSASTNFLIGISDLRGDGRPDYHYAAQVLYADSVTPTRISVNGGPVTVSGTGFVPGSTAAVGTAAARPLVTNAGQMIVSMPAQSDGPQTLTISNPANGGATSMTNALLYGAAATDNIVLLSRLNPPTPVGTLATYPMIVRVVAADDVTPVSGATIGWSAANQVQLSACGGASTCSAITDQDGIATTSLTPAIPGQSLVFATLAPGVYNPAKSVSTTLSATESATDIGVLTPYLWIAQGATVSLPVTARVLSNGTPQPAASVAFSIASGTATLSAPSSTTNSAGYATVTLSLSQFATGVQVNACVVLTITSCAAVYANPVPLAQQNLQLVSGEGQVSAGQPFVPIFVRVVDSSSPPNPVIAANVSFQTTIMRPGSSLLGGGEGNPNPGNPAMPVILSVAQNNATSDVNGLATITPSSAGFSGRLEVDVTATAGASAMLDFPLQEYPAAPVGTGVPPPIAKSQPLNGFPISQ